VEISAVNGGARTFSGTNSAHSLAAASANLPREHHCHLPCISLNNKENCISVPRGPQTDRHHISAGRGYERKNAVKSRLVRMETRNCCFSLFLSFGALRRTRSACPSHLTLDAGSKYPRCVPKCCVYIHSPQLRARPSYFFFWGLP
jgi:hypothetical protein